MCGCNRGAGANGQVLQGHVIQQVRGRRVVQVRSIPAPAPTPTPAPVAAPVAAPRMLVRNVRQVRYQRGYRQQQVQVQIQPQSPYNADTAVWGANMWTVLHTLAASTSSSWPELLQLLTTTIPCEICRNHYTAYLAANPLSDHNQVTVITWLFNLHNDVNLRIGKPLFLEANLPQPQPQISLASLQPIIQNLSVSFPPEVITLLTEMSK